ncbi:MAG TPA: GNAT family N-acetyltransferase [Flavobacteriales bacterium]|nr:GNAT family N-acetyltransferase [Flavobacteriales bacterium]
MSIQWAITSWQQLDPIALHDLIKLRIDVFVVEQQCFYEELDGKDLNALHLLGRNVSGDPVACARVLPPDDDGLPRIGRVAVHPEHRGKGLAHELMRFALDEIEQRYGSKRSKLSAQSHLQAFYAKHGYSAVSEPYLLDGIPHLDMVRTAY